MNTFLRSKLELFFAAHKKFFYPKGEILIRADEVPSGVFYLIEGFVKEYAISKKGNELIVNQFKPGAFFPMSWAINNTPNDYFYEATSAVSLFRAPREDVIAFIKNEPEVMFDLLSRVFKGTDGLLIRMTHLMGANAHARLITELIIYAKRFGKVIEGRNYLHFSETLLASQTGMARETVSREIKMLKEKGLVQLKRNQIVILSIDKLEEELNNDF